MCYRADCWQATNFRKARLCKYCVKMFDNAQCSCKNINHAQY